MMPFFRRMLCVFCALMFACAALPAASDELLTNRNVIDLIKAGLGQELIAKKITTSDTAFDMSPKAMIELKQSGVADPIIELMLQAYMKTQKKMRARIAMEIQNLASDNPEIARKALGYLREIDTAAFAQLEEALESSTPQIRAAAAKTSGDLADKNAVNRLREMLHDPEQIVRFAAAGSLAQFQDDEAKNLARKSIAAGVNPLDGYLRLLGLRKDSEYLGFIAMRLLQDSDAQTRAEAARALGEIGGDRTVKPLEDALINDRETAVKSAAALALGKLQLEGSFDKLADACRRYPQGRKDVLCAIGQYPPAKSVPFLITALSQPLTAEEKTEVLNALRRLTARDYGEDYEAWKKWLDENRDKLPATTQAPVPEPALKSESAPAQ